MAAGLGYKEFATGDVLTAADANGYLASQVVMVFANAAARTSAIASPQEGMISFLKDTNSTEYYSGSAWAAVGATSASGLTLVKTQTIGSAVSSVTVSDAFSSTYDNYRVTITGGTASATNEFYLTFGSTSSNYKYTQLISAWSNTLLTYGSSTASNIQAFRVSANTQNTYMDIMGPNLTKITAVTGASPASGQFHQVYGVLDDTTAYTAFTLTMGAGTITGGTIRVYGYQNS
jgi:hypothetical protein